MSLSLSLSGASGASRGARCMLSASPIPSSSTSTSSLPGVNRKERAAARIAQSYLGIYPLYCAPRDRPPTADGAAVFFFPSSTIADSILKRSSAHCRTPFTHLHTVRARFHTHTHTKAAAARQPRTPCRCVYLNT